MSLLTPKEAAAELGVSTAQLTRLTLDGELPSINIGRGSKRPSRRYHPSDIEAFMTARREIACRSTNAMKEDVRAALEAASPVKSPVTDQNDSAKLLQSNGKD